ncbi:Oxygen-regulated protein 1 [Labeo rohita]|uniref:Oxygen-regulated protein 1 n=1 Tax=Labeo rohita TaxID=84645 RepID=A0ABQ8MHD8_LABRO|nr:Oxygen-regulated protein 1 [Labeo rohita]
MSDAPILRKAIPQAQSTDSGHTQMTSRPLYITEPTASKHVCFYKSGDSQFSGLPVVINSRTFKTFEALLDSLSKRVPLPFGVRTITTPRGHTAVQSLDQLQHGHSYICSDRRTVKPIDFERARRKLPPWYHARPVSARSLAWYTHSSAQHGTCSARRNEHAILLHSPKRLVLFRNGEPEVKHTLMLQRRTTYSFEALLDRMSEVMHFPVLKLHTPDGRRVDGLPALILCSGVLVAAGREPFKKRNYDVQKPSPLTWLPVKRLGRRHPVTRKKKSSSTKSRPFSPSSEDYFVNQIQNSISGSMCDFPSNPNGSVEVEPTMHLESVAETGIIKSRDGEKEDDTHMPSDDDIEKSFKVNQDGSMTVEMKVRLTIKEEETIHWTTTVSRSSVYNQCKATTFSSPDLDANLPDSILPHSDTLTTEVSERDPDDSNHFCPEDGCKVNEETEISEGAASMELERLPSPLSHFPGLHKVQHKQGSTESIKTVRNTEINENHSYSYMEELDSGEVKQEYGMVQHCNHPVPKPRCTLASEIHTMTRLQLSNYRCSENPQFQDNQTKMFETPLHIDKKQTCQENFSGNTQLHLQGFGSSPYTASSNTTFTAASDKIFHSFNEDIKSENLATIKCQSAGKQGTLSPISEPYTSTDKTNTTSTKRAKVAMTPGIASSKASVSKGVTLGTTTRRKPVRVIVKKNHLFKSAIPEGKQRPNKADILKEIKKKRFDILSQKGAMKLNKHFRAKEALEEKEICLYSPKTKKPEQINSDHLTKTRENQQTSELISKKDSYDTENTSLRRPLDIHTKAPTELIDFQAQKFYTVKMAVRPDMKPVLEQLCYYIQSLQLSLKASKCLAEFSSHVESTFSSSSRVLLAFLSVMTLKDGLSYLNACGQADANLRCSEAMLMLQSLKELAAIEDAEHLRISLSDLHNSASVQLLQSWKGFQVLINKARFSSATPETSVSESHQSPSSEEEEHAIQVLMEHLGVPERVIEELAALKQLDENMICNQTKETDKGSDLFPAMKMNAFSELYSKDKMASFPDFVLEDYVNIYVNSVIDRAITAHLKDSDNSQEFVVGSLERPEKDLEAPECYSIYQENCLEIPEETTEYEENENEFKEERASTVAKPIGSLQDQEETVGKRPYNTEQKTGKRLWNYISATNLEASKIVKITETESIDSVASSLAFSYDSKTSDLSKDPEVHIQTNKVKSIRDMFLAKSNTDMQHGQTQLSSPSSELSELESSHRKEYQLLTSSDVSREEKNTCKLSIAKGYVKRTIEQLYGKGSKGCSSDEKKSPSTDKVENRVGLRGTNAIPDLSYFNATSSADSSNEPMNCVTLNTRMGLRDAVPIDKGHWLLKENLLSLKSCSENEYTSKHIKDKDESEWDSGKEDIPYSLFGHSPMMPDKDPSFTEQEEECPGRTITYFHLPNANDSEVHPDELKTDTPKGKTENKVTPLTETPKCWAEKHSFATVFTPMDIIKAANKVHPMIETTPPVITQPTKGQSAVTRHSAEPDALEILYMFCGQHCPIL